MTIEVVLTIFGMQSFLSAYEQPFSLPMSSIMVKLEVALHRKNRLVPMTVFLCRHVCR
jgi:hypothetical protein